MALRMPYHAGIVVPDLAKAVEELTAKLDYTFNTPTPVPVYEIEDRVSGFTGPLEMLVTYTRESPFRLEVIESVGEGVYAVPDTGLHHLGVWEPDPELRLKQFERSGEEIDAIFRQKDGTISVIYTAPKGPAGTRIEYVNESQRHRLERWFDTGVLR